MNYSIFLLIALTAIVAVIAGIALLSQKPQILKRPSSIMGGAGNLSDFNYAGDTTIPSTSSS
jgi:hypothetical protein